MERAGPLAIDVSHLTKKFGRRTAVADVSFSGRGDGRVALPRASRRGLLHPAAGRLGDLDRPGDLVESQRHSRRPAAQHAAGLPPIALIAMMALQVISSTLILAVSLAATLLLIDCAAYLLVSRLFDRERLVTGARPGRG
jgi:hypothetical protein